MSNISRYAVVFPGQGSQSIGMLQELSNAYQEVQHVFNQASEVLGYDLWDICQNGPLEKLNSTEITQPALLTAGFAIWQVYCKHTDNKPNVLAGHSLGEFTALVAARCLDFNDAVKLVAARGKFMQDAVPNNSGAMAAVLGLSDQEINEILKSLDGDGVVEIANLNAIGQTVIAGHREQVIQACSILKEKGAKLVKVLDVSVPSHCSLMQPAADNFKRLLDEVPISKAVIPVIHNYSLESYDDSKQIKQALVKQLTMPVRWVETVCNIRDQGIHLLYEFGPGAVLSKLTKRIDKSMTSVSIESSVDISKIICNK